MARVAVVIANGFEQAEMTAISRILAQSGHHVQVVSPKKHAVRGWDNTHWGADLPGGNGVDLPADQTALGYQTPAAHAAKLKAMGPVSPPLRGSEPGPIAQTAPHGVTSPKALPTTG